MRHRPSEIRLRRKARILEVSFVNGERYQLSFEYLRVYSPSAEVKGHGPGQEVLQAGKKNVSIERIEPVGKYALQLFFDDGHDTGIFSWDYLRELSDNKDRYWQRYLDQLHEAGASRDPDVQVVRIDL